MSCDQRGDSVSCCEDNNSGICCTASHLELNSECSLGERVSL